jgi:hypothetical protein
VARTIDPTLRAYLQHRIRDWVSQPGHTARELARRAGVSGAQMSEALNRGAIGWTTLTGILPVFGLTLATVEEAARLWAAKQPPGDLAPPSSRRTPHRLRDRPEWEAVSLATAEAHGELDPEDVAAVGMILDDRAVFDGPLDVPTIAGLAAVLAARRRRLARQRP